MLMHGAAILDFEVRVGEALPTFRVGNPTSGGALVEISDRELGNSDSPLQMERTINPVLTVLKWLQSIFFIIAIK